MSLPHALLGLIRYRPASGYDLKKTFKNSIHFFWNAALPHIYRTLKQMEGQGWITSSIEHQNGKPSRKVYRLAPDGEKEFQRWLAEPPELPEPRLPILVKIFFGSGLEPDQFRQHLQNWRDFHGRLLNRFEQEVPQVIKKASARTGTAQEVIYWNLTLDYGRLHSRMVMDWCDQALKDLENREKKKHPTELKKEIKEKKHVR